MKNKWWQAGMSLPEVMIGAALLAGLALAGAEMFKQQSKAVKYAKVRSELDRYHNNLVKIMSDYRHCNANFYPSYVSQTHTLNSASLPASLLQCCPTADCTITGTQCEMGYPFAANTRPIAVLNADIGAGTSAAGFTPTSFDLYDINGANSITANGFETRKAEIRVTYTLRGKLAGVKTVVKKIPVMFKFLHTGRFVSCVDAQTNTKITLQKEICNGAGPNLMIYDPRVDKCRRRNYYQGLLSCPVGQVLLGLDANGAVACQTARDAFDEAQAINTTNATGCTSTNVKFSWDSGTNTIKVECLP